MNLPILCEDCTKILTDNNYISDALNIRKLCDDDNCITYFITHVDYEYSVTLRNKFTIDLFKIIFPNDEQKQILLTNSKDGATPWLYREMKAEYFSNWYKPIRVASREEILQTIISFIKKIENINLLE